ncbi:MAG: hypothetical protein WEC84_03270 [Candidatus Andersenbacteria bacterium]
MTKQEVVVSLRRGHERYIVEETVVTSLLNNGYPCRIVYAEQDFVCPKDALAVICIEPTREMEKSVATLLSARHEHPDVKCVLVRHGEAKELKPCGIHVLNPWDGTWIKNLLEILKPP